MGGLSTGRMSETVLDAVRRHARERGDHLAYRTPARTWSFAQVDEASNRVAQGLKSLNIGQGDRVACLTKQTADCAVLVLGANKIGAVCMPVNWRLAPPEIEYIVKDGQAKLMMADAAFVSAVGSVKTFATEEFPSWYGKFESLDPGKQPGAEETALQLYSSGTTGLPKGVELTHRNLMVAMVEAVPEAIGYRGPPDVMLNVLPTYHIAGIGVALLTASKGGMSVLYPDFDPAKAVAAIAEHRITHSFLVPAMIQFMLQAPGAGEADYSSLRGISYGASPIPEIVLLNAMRTFKCGFVQVYGLTETTGAITRLAPEDHDPEGPKRQDRKSVV